MGILLVVVGTLRLSEGLYITGVETKVIGVKSLIAPKDVLAPQVGVRTALVHGSIRLESVLDVVLVLLKSQFDVLLVGIRSADPIEVTSDTVLLVMESLKVCSSDRVNVRGDQLAEHASKTGTTNVMSTLCCTKNVAN